MNRPGGTKFDSPGPFSFLELGNDFAATSTSDSLPGGKVDVVADELDVPVGK